VGYVWRLLQLYRGEPVEGTFASAEEAGWEAVLRVAKQPERDRKRTPPRLTDDQDAGRLIRNAKGEILGGVLGAAGRADGRFAAWGRRGKINEFATEAEAEAAVHADARAKAREKRRPKND
jgi:hypothetical protein